MKALRRYIALSLLWATEPFYMLLDMITDIAQWFYDPDRDEEQ